MTAKRSRPARGFSLFEVIVALAILSIAALGLVAVSGLYLARIAAVRQAQQIDSQADAVIASFRAGGACTEHLRAIWGTLPTALPGGKTQHDLNSLVIDGVRLNLDRPGTPGRFPEFLIGHVLQASFDVVSGVPLPGARVARAEFRIRYRLESESVIRTRRAAIFLGVDASGRIERCLDAAAYRRMEVLESLCARVKGVFNHDGTCDTSASTLVQRRTCEAAGTVYRGRCVRI